MGETNPEVVQKENPCMNLLLFMTSQTDHTKNTNHATVKREGLIILKGKKNVPGCMKYPPVSWQPHSRRWLANVPCANCMSFQFQPNS